MYRRLLFCFTLAIGLALGGHALAAPPSTITYQGTLGTAGGTPINETLNISFRLYDAATGGTALWSETQSVVVRNGKFAVELGSTQPLVNELFASSLFLGIEVADDVEMTPRPRLSSAPNAFRARSLMRNTVHVAADGTPLQNGTALRNAVAGVAGAAANNRYVIHVDAGEFDLGSAILVVPSFIDLQGAGRASTVLKSTAAAAALQLQSDSGISALAVINNGSGGDFTTPTTAVEVAASAQRVSIRSAAINSSPAGTTQGTDVRVALRFTRASGLHVSDVDLRAERSANLYGIRVSGQGSSGIVEKDIVLRDISIFVSAATNFARGVDAFGRMQMAIQNMRIVMDAGGLTPVNTLGFRSQFEVAVTASGLEADLNYAGMTPTEARGLAFSQSARVHLNDFRVRMETAGCPAGGFRNGVVFHNKVPGTGELLQEQPKARDGLVEVIDTDCFAGGIFSSGSKAIIDNVRVDARQNGATAAAIAYLHRASSDLCDAGVVQAGVGEIRNSSLSATAAGGYAAAAEVCVSGLNIENTTLTGGTHGLMANNNTAVSGIDFKVRHSRLISSSGAAFALSSDAVASISNSSLESTSGSPVSAFVDAESSARGSIRCLATTTNTSFVAGPTCTCTSSPDCPVTP